MLKCKTLAGSYSKGRRLSWIIMMSSSVLLISFLRETLAKDIFILFNDTLQYFCVLFGYSCNVKNMAVDQLREYVLWVFIIRYSRSIFSGILVRHF